tara:strand:+ start:167 stop:934 length:768 start_codon:yes stop_codon:yes gene_type:complete
VNSGAFGASISSPHDIGFVNKYVINTEEGSFDLTVIANFLVSSHTLSANKNMLHFDIVSNFNHENIGEIIIPHNLMNGEFTVLLDNKEISANVNKTTDSTIIVIKFDGKGDRTIDIITSESFGGGCLIATAAFGSEMAPQIQLLREIRDNTVIQTESGASFMTGFNQFYYSFSPVVADYERENPAFKEAVKIALTPLLTSLTLLQYVNIDSESEMLGYGIGIILLNIGMYLVVPAIIIAKIRKRVNMQKLNEKYV